MAVKLLQSVALFDEELVQAETGESNAQQCHRPASVTNALITENTDVPGSIRTSIGSAFVGSILVHSSPVRKAGCR
jgi:hypothetical protein